MKRRRRHGATGARGAAVADINITPMVDVLLCLLILVMVIQPGLVKGLDLQVPPPEPAEAYSAAQARDQIILRVGPGPAYTLNHEAVPAAGLTARITEVFRDRPRKVLFVEGAEDAEYAEVVEAVDLARAAGIRVVGLVPRERTAAEEEERERE
ncbi:MAG TPA: biopolymer transporter ExbD [Gemmatimonadales bacterium]|nr:biopolymer transporter ExbD [Gemmatimonadales bacterium]